MKESNGMAVVETPAAPSQAFDAGRPKGSSMGPAAKTYYAYRRGVKALRLFGAIAGPGIIVMVADNDAGGITTYTTTGAKYGLSPVVVPSPAGTGGLLRAGNDGPPGGRHQTRPCGGDLRRVRRVSGAGSRSWTWC